jgi:hypothetical protein
VKPCDVTNGEIWQIGRDSRGKGEPYSLFTRLKGEEGYTMANEEHLAQLKQGVEAWNAWREKHPEV